MKMSPDSVELVLKQGGFLERKDERRNARCCVRWKTRLYDKAGKDLGVASYAKTKLIRMAKLIEYKGPQGEQRWKLRASP